MRPDRSIIRGYCIFCDDIREEVGGKQSFMGIYGGSLVIESETFPTKIPKFCIYTNIRLYRDEPVPPRMTLKVFVPGSEEPGVTAEFSTPAMMNDPPETAPEDVDAFWNLNLNMVLAPFEVKESGRIRVRVYHGDEEWKLGSIELVAKQTPPSSV